MKQKLWLVIATEEYSSWNKPKVYVESVYSNKEAADKSLDATSKAWHAEPELNSDPTIRIVKEIYKPGSSYFIELERLSISGETIRTKHGYVIKGRIVQD